MIRKRVLVLMTLVCIALVSCSSTFLDDGYYFYIENDGAVMSVWIRGNSQSDVFLIVLSGGPGTPNHLYVDLPAFNTLEGQYNIVYWDQRATGTSQGNPDPSTFTQEQFSEDTRLLVETVAVLHPGSRLFLMGHSWGGYLGTRYLIDYQQEDGRIAGWVYVDGLHDYPLNYELTLDWLEGEVETLIASGEDLDYWRAASAWLDSDPPYNEESYHLSNEYMANAGGVYFDPEFSELDIVSWPLVFASPENLASDFLNGPHLQESFMDRIHYSLSDSMGSITLPTMILWGQEDGNIPVGMAYDAVSRLGTDPADIHLRLFEESAHVPMMEEPQRFADEVTAFIEQYR
jgi:pimeloyl-ACP methyl ester carboxylesterase